MSSLQIREDDGFFARDFRPDRQWPVGQRPPMFLAIFSAGIELANRPCKRGH